MNNPALPPYPAQNHPSYPPASTSQPFFNQPGPYTVSPNPPFDNAQIPFQPSMIQSQNHPIQRQPNIQHPQQSLPQNFYLQHQQQQQQLQAQQLHQNHQPAFSAFDNPPHHINQNPPYPGNQPPTRPSPAQLKPTSRQNSNSSANHISTPTPTQSIPPPTSTPSGDPAMAATLNLQGQPGATLAQQAQMQNAAQMARPVSQQQSQPPQSQQALPTTPISPHAAARERSRVSVLLDINTQLLMEVVSLQAQGKAGNQSNPGQPPPTSPVSATDPNSALNNSPGDPPKSAGGSNPSKPPSQEYADCMRRLQANLSYLAAIADAKKKVNGALPPGPAIMFPPPHLTQVQDLYKRLNELFPEASQSASKKAAGQSQSQDGSVNQQPAASVLAQG